MKKILLFAAIVSIVACTNEKEKESPSVPDILLSVTDKAGESLEGRDFSVYIVAKETSSSEALSSARLYDGVLAEYLNGTLEFSDALTYDYQRPYCDFYVFSPYYGNTVPAGGNMADVSVARDQSSGIEASDIMFGKTVNFIRKEQDPQVELSHLFSRLDFVIETTYPADDFDVVVLLSDVELGGTYNAEECVLTLSGEKGQVKSAGKFAAAEDGLLKGVSAIIPPQTLKAGDFANIMIGGSEYTLTLDEDLVLEAGKVAQVTFSITAEPGQQVEVSVTVRDWEEEVFDFSTGKLLPPGETVTDIDGNEYPVVKIGSLYWMGANLRTTKLKDGTEIQKIESLDEWPVTDKAAYTAYEYDF